MTQLAAPSVYSLHPNMFGILITSLHYNIVRGTQEHIPSDNIIVNIDGIEQVFLYPTSLIITIHDIIIST